MRSLYIIHILVGFTGSVFAERNLQSIFEENAPDRVISQPPFSDVGIAEITVDFLDARRRQRNIGASHLREWLNSENFDFDTNGKSVIMNAGFRDEGCPIRFSKLTLYEVSDSSIIARVDKTTDSGTEEMSIFRRDSKDWHVLYRQDGVVESDPLILDDNTATSSYERIRSDIGVVAHSLYFATEGEEGDYRTLIEKDGAVVSSIRFARPISFAPGSGLLLLRDTEPTDATGLFLLNLDEGPLERNGTRADYLFGPRHVESAAWSPDGAFLVLFQDGIKPVVLRLHDLPVIGD